MSFPSAHSEDADARRNAILTIAELAEPGDLVVLQHLAPFASDRYDNVRFLVLSSAKFMELAFFQDEEAAANSNENCLENPERERVEF